MVSETTREKAAAILNSPDPPEQKAKFLRQERMELIKTAAHYEKIYAQKKQDIIYLSQQIEQLGMIALPLD